MKTFLFPTLVLGALVTFAACGDSTEDPQPVNQPTASDDDNGGGDTDSTGGDPTSADPTSGDTDTSGGDNGGGDSTTGGDESAPATCNGVAVSDACLAVNCENELQVGRPCTAGGGECGDFSLTKAWLCTADFYESHLSFCTMTCQTNDQCGANAVCGTDPDDPGAGAGCVPVACAD